MDQNEIEAIKIVHPSLVEEIHRYRDWPIRVLTFTSAFNFGIMGLILVSKINVPSVIAKRLLTFAVICIGAWTIFYFCRCHLNYLGARVVQCKVQKKLGLSAWEVGGERVFPDEWFTPRSVSVCAAWWGWGFYAFYAFIVTALTIAVIWGWGIRPAQ